MPKYVSFPHIDGKISRQAHADMPPGTYEREIAKEGFFGPGRICITAIRRPAGRAWEGPSAAARVRPEPAGAAAQASPWAAPRVLTNAALDLRFWNSPRSMPALARNADGDQLLFVHAGSGELFCDYGHLADRGRRLPLLPRGTMWRHRRRRADQRC